jgi:hypothetical protein
VNFAMGNTTHLNSVSQFFLFRVTALFLIYYSSIFFLYPWFYLGHPPSAVPSEVFITTQLCHTIPPPINHSKQAVTILTSDTQINNQPDAHSVVKYFIV